MKFKLLSVYFAIACLLASGCQFSDNNKKTSNERLKTIRISSHDDPQSFDPRMVRDLESVTYIHMLYEGLMRFNFQGNAVFALAKSVDIAPDFKTYTFHLRPSTWTNGDPVTAYDFEYAWKSSLDPHIPAPNANQFYIIKGAKEAKEGKGLMEAIGIHAISPDILTVELVSPIPYFLELAATNFYLPVNKKWADEGSQINKLESNGPFKLHSFKHHNEFVVVKNPLYWDAQSVKIDKIVLQVLDENTGLQLFDVGELDWHGSPTATLPADAIQTLKAQGRLRIKSGAGTHWIRFNTRMIPFDNVKLRRAFALAIDRKSLVEHILQGNQIPAMAIVPPSLKLHPKPYFEDHDVTAAWSLFQAALEELNISKDDFPAVALCYPHSDRNSRIAQALQQQWKKALGINVKLQNCEGMIFYDKLSKHDYQISLGSWFADIQDPINFLALFQYSSNSTNNTLWENAKYTDLLNQSLKESKLEERMSLYLQAEQILIDEMPVAPLFYSSFNYLKADHLKGVNFLESGYLDFKDAFFENDRDF